MHGTQVIGFPKTLLLECLNNLVRGNTLPFLHRKTYVQHLKFKLDSKRTVDISNTFYNTVKNSFQFLTKNTETSSTPTFYIKITYQSNKLKCFFKFLLNFLHIFIG